MEDICANRSLKERALLGRSKILGNRNFYCPYKAIIISLLKHNQPSYVLLAFKYQFHGWQCFVKLKFSVALQCYEISQKRLLPQNFLIILLGSLMLQSNQQQGAQDELFNVRGNTCPLRETGFSRNLILTFVFRILRCTDKFAFRLRKSRFAIKWSILVVLYEKS